jgi:hypothetical protein
MDFNQESNAEISQTQISSPLTEEINKVQGNTIANPVSISAN